MKRKYSRLFVCKWHLLTLLCMHALAGMAQAPPTCPSPLLGGKASVSATSTCLGSTVSFGLSDYTTGGGFVYFLEQTNSLTTPFQIVGANPDPSQLTVVVGVPDTNYYRIRVFCPYGQDANSDTLIVVGLKPLSGLYTINAQQAASTTNFTSFSEAVARIANCGISGPVIFEVTSSDYNYKEQISIPQINGASAVNTITFNGNGNTVSYGNTGYYDNRYIVKLDGADHIIFDSLKVDATVGISGYGIVLTNDADSNTFRKCIVNAGVNSTNGNYTGIVISGVDNNTDWNGSNCDNNVFDHNTVLGGYIGIAITGDAANNQVTNNTLQDFAFTGLFIDYTSNSTIAGNSFSRPKRSGFSNVYAIRATSGNMGMRITGNRIFDLCKGDPTNTGTMYGIDLEFCDASISSPNIVANNLLYNFTGAGPVNGLYNNSSDYALFYHNTVSLDFPVNQTSTQATAGLYFGSSATGAEFKNNIVSIQRTGSGNKYCIYKANTGISCISDNNDFYIAGANNLIGYNGTAQGTMALWRASSGQDAATVNYNPLYLDTTAGNFTPNNTQLDNLGAAVGVTDDIIAAVRSTTTPDIGAYEFAHVTCTNPPTAGTVSISQAPICLSESSTLSIVGGDVGAGISYQWQSSPDSASWTDINTANARTVTITQSADTWYRAVSTCGAGSTPSAGVLIRTIQGASGNYTINKAVATGGRNFRSFNDAWNAIRCGISGPVVFDVTPSSGTYEEQLIMSPVSGTSTVNTITFNGNGNTIAYASDNSNQRAVIKLNGVDHVIINDLVVKATGTGNGQYGYGIQLTNNSDTNIVRHCTIYADTTTAEAKNYAGIVVNSNSFNNTPDAGEALSDDNIFEDNTIIGGYYNMTLVGSTNNSNLRTIIRRNIFSNFYYGGIYSANAAYTVIDSNILSRPTRSTVGQFWGIYQTGVQVKTTISRNRIFNPFGGSPDVENDFYGIHFSGADGSAGNENIVSNNLIYNITGKGNVYGIYNNGSDRAWYYHNTLCLDGTVNGLSTYGFYQTTLAGNIRFRNNIVMISRAGDGSKYAMYYDPSGSVISSENNDLYVATTDGAPYIGYNGGDRKILADWQVAISGEANSTSVDPVFADVANGDLTPKNSAINNMGQPLASVVPTDIVSKVRNTTNPDPGAYEFDPTACTTPVAGNAVANSVSSCEGNTVELNLSGSSVGGAQTYQWQAATSPTGSYASVSNAQPNPLFNIVPGSSEVYYRAAITCGSTTVYTQPVVVSASAKLAAGVYTIDQNGTGDFMSFNEAKAAMSCGIKGPVVFNVLPGSGPYNEQLILDTIVGTSAVNTVTFNGNGNTINFSSTDDNARAVIILNRADYITFDSLVINAEGSGYYGQGVFITNNADNNIFRRCTIEIPLDQNYSGYSGIVIGGSPDATTFSDAFCDNNLFERNTVIGGNCGMSMMSGYNSVNVGNKFIGNIVKDFYEKGIYIGGAQDAVIEGNSISRPTRTSIGDFTGIHVYAGTTNSISHNLLISKNKIYNTSGGNMAYPYSYQNVGIRIESNDAALNKPVVIANNLIYNFNGQNAIYGIYNSGSDNIHCYHNTISLDNKLYTGSSTAYGIYNSSSVKGVDIKNNIITVLRGGTGNKAGLYFSSTSSQFTSDNNDIWVDTTGTAKYIGYFGGNKVKLSDWQAITITGNPNPDLHSVSRNPEYEDTTAGKFKPLLADLDNLGTPVGISTDINNDARSSARPDMGAFEFSTTVCTSPPTPGAAAVTPSSGICRGAKVKLSLSGNSEGGFQKYVWQRAASNAGPWTTISDSASASDLTYELVSADTYFRAVVVCGSGVAYSTPAQVTLNGGLAAGDYTIDPSKPAASGNFQSFNEAVAAMSCGIEGSVRFLVVAGTYNERVSVPKIPGTSASATVTFTSQDNTASSVTLTAPCTVDSNYVLKLDTTNYIAFKNMTITANGTAYGRGVQLTGSSSYDSIAGCIINLPASTTTTLDIAGVYAEEVSGTANAIVSNTITKGTAGIYLNGVTPVSEKWNVDQNTISGSYFYNIYAGNLNRLSVSGNTITKDGVQNINTHGIFLYNCDSAFRVDKNNITITNTGSKANAIWMFLCAGSQQEKGSVSGNKIVADATNTGDVYGLQLYTSTGNLNAMNNVIAIATKGDNAYGIYSGGNGGCNYYNNSVQLETPAVNSVAAYFSDNTAVNGSLNIYNNIFSNLGGGVAMSMFRPGDNRSDYNLFYSNGTGLIQYNTAILSTLKEWQDTGNVDYSSLVYLPAFSSNTTLTPDVSKPEVWALNGRGVQIDIDNVDINSNNRPTTLQTGVPDLGAYEFTPTSEPVALEAIPTAPAPNSTQTFMLGTDTVARITWGSVVPSSVEGKRYSGKAPDGLATGQPFMYFYTAFTTTGTAPAGYTVQQFYIDSWRGTIDAESFIKLGKTNGGATWNISANSTIDSMDNAIRDTGLTALAKFTGLTDGKAAIPPPIEILARDSSNRGTKFWAPYANTVLFRENTQDMVIYIGAGDQEAHVTIRVNGTTWTRRYTVPANTAITSDLIPKTGNFDARLLQEGLSERGISIESDVPVAAYAHIYAPSGSGATMLMPVGTYGYEYYSLSARQTYSPNGSNAGMISIIAAYDSTVVEITPAGATQGGRQANVPFTVTLKKGEVYQVLGAIDNTLMTSVDLTGTKIRSIHNANGKCWPIAVFSGSSLTGFDCGQFNSGGTGDNIIQQNFPYQAWGKKYLTAPTSEHSAANILLSNVFRISVKDPSTVVKRNGVVLSNLINNSYYEYASSTADYITSDKPIMVAEFQSSAWQCGSTDKYGDPEMMYLSPLEQGIKEVALYRNTTSAIIAQFLTLIIPTTGVSSLTIDGLNSYDYSYPHPNMPGYTVIVKRWEATKGQTVVKSDSTFTAITYGMGEYESYGYNAGTMVLNLNTKASITNTYSSTQGYSDYTCAGTPFRLSLLSTVVPTAIDWKLSGAGVMTPNADVHIDNPVAVETLIINGVTYYKYALTQDYSISAPGTYKISAYITHPDIDACDSRQETIIPIKVVPAPVVDFTVTGSCTATPIQFAGSVSMVNNASIIRWTWDFDDAGAGSSKKDTVYTYSKAGDYDVKLSIIDVNGCVSDTVKTIAVKAALTAPILKAISVTSNSATFGWAAVPNATGYEVSTDDGATWVTPSSGATGLTHTESSLQLGQTVSLQVRALGSCVPAVSNKVSITTAIQDVYIPNSFTPDHNGPAENETFKIYCNSIKQMRLMIFNQWGEKVFETNNQAEGWDGRYKGKPQPSGVYIYVADIIQNNDKRETKKGTVNLIR